MIGPNTLEQLVDLLAERVAARLGDRDELVPIAAEPLAALGLELRAVQRLVANGTLRAVDIGRRRFTKRSHLLALVDELPPAGVRPANDAEQVDELHKAVAKAARRSARASARKADRAERRGPRNAA